MSISGTTTTKNDTTNKKGSPNTNVSSIRLMSIMIVLIGCVLGLIVLRKSVIKD